MNKRTWFLAATASVALAVGCRSCSSKSVFGANGDSNNQIPSVYLPFFEGGIPSEKVDPLLAALPYRSISMSRSGCFGTCPVYEVTLRSNLKADFVGIKYVNEIGAFEGEVDIFQFGRLCYLLDRMKFQSMQSKYQSRWTDNETILVTANTGSQEVSVSEYGHVGPIELWAIHQAIDNIRHEIKWRPIPATGLVVNQGRP